MGKGSGRYHTRQQISEEVMNLRWDLAFTKCPLLKAEIKAKLKQLEEQDVLQYTDQQGVS
jgi:hypothetical protein